MKRSILLVIFSAFCLFGFAQKTSQLKKLEEQRKRAMLEITNTDKLLQTTNRTATSLLNRIQLIGNQIKSRQEVLTLLEQEVEGISKEQGKIEAQIEKLEENLEEQKGSYARAINGMQINRQGQNKILFVLSGKSLSESYRRFHYLKEFSTWVGSQADAINHSKEKLNQKKGELAESKYEKVSLLRLRERERESLLNEELSFQREAKEVDKKQKELEKALQAKKKQADALDKQIEKLIAEEIAKQKAEAAKRAKAKKKAESAKPKPVEPGSTKPSKKPDKPEVDEITPEDLKLSKNFASNKGKLPLPISGSPSIVGRFGTQYHKEWKVSTASNGIDFQSHSGAAARAVFEGEVTRIMPFPGYNNCIIIRHGDYYTFYANIKTLDVKQGDRVQTGQNLGTVYTDPDSNVSQVHFQLWKGTTKLNPEPWLR